MHAVSSVEEYCVRHKETVGFGDDTFRSYIHEIYLNLSQRLNGQKLNDESAHKAQTSHWYSANDSKRTA